MVTRDRVRLDADVYRPDAAGDFPVLLMRQPYGRAIASTVVYAHPLWYAAHGYIVVIQDVRGRGTSEGDFDLFTHEVADGEDTLEWAATLPGSNGRVGMYGFSYQGMTQLYAAASQHPALKTICPAMVGYDLYTDWAYENGAFCLQANLGWAIQLAAETARRQNDAIAHHTLSMAGKNLIFGDSVPTRSGILNVLAPDSFYHTWLTHSEPDSYWEQRSPKFLIESVDLPMLHIGGWYDTFLRGTLNLYQAMVARSQRRQQLIVGPWAHLPWGRKVGAKDFGPEAVSPCDRLQLQWFDHFLKDHQTNLGTESCVQLFELGTNQWITQSSWADTSSTPFYLVSDGLAGFAQHGGLTGDWPPASPIPDVLVHDPWRPVPSHGGHAAIPAGPQERSAIDDRTDVLTYTSAPLATNLHLSGDVILYLYCSSDSVSFDLSAVLSEVAPNGLTYNLTQGYLTVKSEAIADSSTTPIKLQLQSICACIAAGSALRLSLSAACFPAYPVNPGTGESPKQAQLINQQIITIMVLSGGNVASHLQLPVVSYDM